MNIKSIGVAFLSVAIFACHGATKDPDDTGATVTTTVGSGGGEISLAGLSFTIPAGALTEDVEITITETTAAPADYEAYSSVFVFEPSGLTFESPVTVRIPFTGSDPNAGILWSNAGGTDYDAIGGTAVEGRIEAQVTHFSDGFVGNPLVGFQWLMTVMEATACEARSVERDGRIVFGPDGYAQVLVETQDWNHISESCCAPVDGGFCDKETFPYDLDGAAVSSTVDGMAMTFTWEGDHLSFSVPGGEGSLARVAPVSFDSSCVPCPW